MEDMSSIFWSLLEPDVDNPELYLPPDTPVGSNPRKLYSLYQKRHARQKKRLIAQQIDELNQYREEFSKEYKEERFKSPPVDAFELISGSEFLASEGEAIAQLLADIPNIIVRNETTEEEKQNIVAKNDIDTDKVLKSFKTGSKIIGKTHKLQRNLLERVQNENLKEISALIEEKKSLKRKAIRKEKKNLSKIRFQKTSIQTQFSPPPPIPSPPPPTPSPSPHVPRPVNPPTASIVGIPTNIRPPTVLPSSLASSSKSNTSTFNTSPFKSSARPPHVVSSPFKSNARPPFERPPFVGPPFVGPAFVGLPSSFKPNTRPPHVGSSSSARPPHVGYSSSARPPHVGYSSSARPPNVGPSLSARPPNVGSSLSARPPYVGPPSSFRSNTRPPHVGLSLSARPPNVGSSSSVNISDPPTVQLSSFNNFSKPPTVGPSSYPTIPPPFIAEHSTYFTQPEPIKERQPLPLFSFRPPKKIETLMDEGFLSIRNKPSRVVIRRSDGTAKSYGNPKDYDDAMHSRTARPDNPVYKRRMNGVDYLFYKSDTGDVVTVGPVSKIQPLIHKYFLTI